MPVLYLHGFASSARSSKAAFFARKFGEHGIELRTPDFNEPDFSTLTVTRMIDQVGAAMAALTDGDVVLIGSSLGAIVAIQCALRWPQRVQRLVLLAPALEFNRERLRGLGDVDAWERDNRLEVFHYAYGRIMSIRYDIVRDAGRYDCINVELPQPVQIFQGRRDTAVNPESVERWAGLRPGVELHMLDDDHQLMGSLDYIWREMTRFLATEIEPRKNTEEHRPQKTTEKHTPQKNTEKHRKNSL